jgi:Xaa-Pro aminopeptidase
MNNRAELLVKKFTEENYDAILITNPINRAYISNFTGSAGVVIIARNAKYVISDFRYMEQLKEQSADFTIINHEGKMFAAIHDLFEKLNVKNVALEGESLSAQTYQTLITENPNITFVLTDNIIEEIRAIKTPAEFELLKKAAAITDEVYDFILKKIKPGMSELEIANLMEFHAKSLGADGCSFETIIASGVRGALPHGHASEKLIAKNELITLDFGYIYKGYFADITRTIAVGKVSDELRNVYDIVLDAQKQGAAAVKAGLTGKDIDTVCRTIIEQAGFGQYFGHGTGHGLGRECHEFPSVNQKSETILQSGMYITIEPGIYLPEVGGVRIEDDVIVTEKGGIIVTTAPKEWIEL